MGGSIEKGGLQRGDHPREQLLGIGESVVATHTEKLGRHEGDRGAEFAQAHIRNNNTAREDR